MPTCAKTVCFVFFPSDTPFLFSGGDIASTFDHPELVKLGSCKLIEEVMIGEDNLIHFSGVALGMYGFLNVTLLKEEKKKCLQ